jgi:MFS family permease
VATRIATGIGFAGLGVVAVLTIGVLLPARLQGTGQALYQTTAFGLAAIVANIVGGVLYSQWGHAAVFATSLVLAILAALVGTLALPRELTRLDKTTRPV